LFHCSLFIEQCKQPFQFLFRSIIGHRLPGFRVPVAGVAGIALDAVEIGMDQAGEPVGTVLHQLMGRVPLAVADESQRPAMQVAQSYLQVYSPSSISKVTLRIQTLT
jgi:hypothetical protein